MNRAGVYVDNLFGEATASELGISYNTVATVIKKLVGLGILSVSRKRGLNVRGGKV